LPDGNRSYEFQSEPRPDPIPRLHPPSQMRALQGSARLFAADAPAVSIDDTAEAWATVKSAVVTEDGLRAIAQLQKAMGDVRDEVSRDAKPVAPIDWPSLKAKSGFPTIVEQFKQGLESVKYPVYDGDEVATTKATFAKLVAEAEKAVALATTREAELDAELASIAEDKKKLSTITMDEVFEKEPGLKKEVEERIRNDQWF
jgi:F-type H+-transporting ATPase subunit d